MKINLFLAIVVFAFLITSSNAFAQQSDTSEWYFGKKISEKQYFKYEICYFEYNDCSPFEIELWVKQVQLKERQYIIQALAIDGDKKIRGNIFIDKDTMTISQSSIDISPYAKTLNDALFWIASIAPKEQPRQLYDGHIWNITQNNIILRYVVESNLTSVANVTSDYILHNSEDDVTKNNVMWINSELPFPIKASFNVQKGHERYSQDDPSKNKTLELKLLEYESITIPDFLYYNESLENEGILFEGNTRAIKLSENSDIDVYIPLPIRGPLTGVWVWIQNVGDAILFVDSTTGDDWSYRLKVGNSNPIFFPHYIDLQRISIEINKIKQFGYFEIAYYYKLTDEQLQKREDNNSPVANAGSNFTVMQGEGKIITLNASNSYDLEGDRLTYEWKQIKGSKVILSSKYELETSFDTSSIKFPETLEFEFAINDPYHTAVTDVVHVTVKNPPLKQLKNNVNPNFVVCGENLLLMIKISDLSPACVKASSISKLSERGWGIPRLDPS